jgi:hypothetical protein
VLPSFRNPDYTAVTALDARDDPPVPWVSSPMSKFSKFDLLRIEDRGGSFEEPVDVGRRNAAARPHAGPVLDLELDRLRGRLHVDAQLFDLAADAWGPGPREATGKSTGNQGVGSIGLDGNFYPQIFPNLVRRIGPDLRPIPFTAGRSTAKGDLPGPPAIGDMRIRGRGVTADARGNLYVLWEDQEHCGRDEAFNDVDRHAPDGSVTKERLIDGGLRSLNSVRVDPAGNVHLDLGLRPGDDLLPPGSPKSLRIDRFDGGHDGNGQVAFPLFEELLLRPR